MLLDSKKNKKWNECFWQGTTSWNGTDWSWISAASWKFIACRRGNAGQRDAGWSWISFATWF